MRLKNYINNQLKNGRCSFSLTVAEKELGKSNVAQFMSYQIIYQLTMMIVGFLEPYLNQKYWVDYGKFFRQQHHYTLLSSPFSFKDFLTNFISFLFISMV